MTQRSFTQVYVLQYHDGDSVTVLGVFADLQDANHECICHAREAGITLTTESSTLGPDKGHILPIEPVRWDTADGVSCWVEEFTVAPKRVITPTEAIKQR